MNMYVGTGWYMYHTTCVSCISNIVSVTESI